MAKLSNIDKRGDEYFVMTYSQTVDGFWVLDGTPERLSTDASAVELGQAIRAALDKSRQDVPNPGRDGDPGKHLRDLVGAPDYGSYLKGVTSVGVRATNSDGNETIKITPKRNEGGASGLTPIKSEAVSIMFAGLAELGETVVAAFAKAL